METFIEVKALAENPDYPSQRQAMLLGLTDAMIDKPIIDLVNGLNRLPYCFTLQSCFGHFVYNGQADPHHLDPLPASDAVFEVEYRMAYIAICIENSVLGQSLLDALKEVTAVDPENVQFGCAEWFWERQVNSFALQVGPHRFRHSDTAMVDFREALQIEKIRNEFYSRLYALLERETKENIG